MCALREAPRQPSQTPGADIAAVALLASLLKQLAGLHSLSLDLLLPLDPLQQQLLHDALAALPHLEELTLSHTALAFTPVGALADRVRPYKFMAWRTTPDNNTIPGLDNTFPGFDCLLSSAPALRALHTVDITLAGEMGDIVAAGLQQLLRKPPPALRTLVVSYNTFVPSYRLVQVRWRLVLSESGARVIEARQGGGLAVTLSGVAKFASQVLLPVLLHDDGDDGRHHQQQYPHPQDHHRINASSTSTDPTSCSTCCGSRASSL